MPLSLMVLLITLMIGGSYLIVNSYSSKEDSAVLSEQSSPQEIESVPTGQPSINPTPTVPAIAIPTPSPTLAPQNFIGDFVYPNSKKVSGGENSFVLESNDNPDSITDWYKEKIRNLGMNVKTFVTTKTNGKVLNKLVGAGREGEVIVEISKSAGSGVVEIRVDR
ncbi:MAG: hypothetical protein ACD_30C00026G0002 [uncultured bacterium]|uniref:Uncharacterized protein n=4 Tax=Candidatus Daviesiibacteriota TaxID=1752718 RepID=A0A0G0F9U4_9BACT|nr:MAG: hypothetical protein ACD_30C00026G0002 [uncultured bacterium]KKQ10260.1 MAG: hypothetical protein US19_C0007G0005 [Candidatus Daviesbacteria bacterium GW2011_GWB1_36_5]KKQ16359.1 MAG: hypothetical protein US28_C0002G0026 [Candidatus Daviesbacteria bacterium GW2011_GWA1_36_8]OGE16375.1 MAG: hypothetical protein A2858_04195 [Candidatus Daviesbacteria bacterium RIFCSPHIGHO2_01_FULL_36_37]OGE35648.1 MAG: hypothetical protein A3E66_04335 [Candidatus Daviesbacteria bacterium RIFCSPHIGHO2_12_F